MRTIIAGSRSCCHFRSTVQAIASARSLQGIAPTRVLSGGCSGPDEYGEEWARSCGIGVDVHNAQWSIHGKRAGPIRNQEMVDSADALIAVWDGFSRGTADVIKKAKAAGLRVYVHRC